VKLFGVAVIVVLAAAFFRVPLGRHRLVLKRERLMGIGQDTNLWLDFGVLTGAAIAGICAAAALLGRLAR